jgi:hypothetical protein
LRLRREQGQELFVYKKLSSKNYALDMLFTGVACFPEAKSASGHQMHLSTFALAGRL